MLFNKRCCCQMNPCQQPNPCQDQCQVDSCQRPIMEPVITNCIEKEFYHEVKHCCPIHTHVINKHIYTHTYTPEYTCDEENVIINNDCGGCSGLIGR